MSGASALPSTRTSLRKRSNNSPCSTGSTAVIPRQNAITELAALPRPWQRIPRSRANRTASHITRKNPEKPSLPITASSCSICAACLGDTTPPHRSRAPTYACSRRKLMSSYAAGTANVGMGGRIHAKSRGSHSAAMRALSHNPSVRPRHRRSISAGANSRQSPLGCSTPRAAASSMVSSARSAVSMSCTSRPASSTYRGSCVTTHGTRSRSASDTNAPASAASAPPVWCSCTSTASRSPNSSCQSPSRRRAPSSSPARMRDASGPDPGPVSACTPSACCATCAHVTPDRPRRWRCAVLSQVVQLPTRAAVTSAATLRYPCALRARNAAGMPSTLISAPAISSSGGSHARAASCARTRAPRSAWSVIASLR